MLYQHDVTIVDEHLAGKKDDCLQRLAKRIGDVEIVGNLGREFRRGGKIGHCDCGGVRGNHSWDAETQHDEQERSTESNQSFKDQIGAEAMETV